MGWLDTMLDVGIIGMQINQRHQLEQLQAQHASAVLLQKIVQALKDEIFKYKKMAEEILEMEPQHLKATAGAMELLHLRLQDFGVTPDMFPEISDKEYVSATIKFIRDNRNRLIHLLPPAEQKEIEGLVTTTSKLSEYSYYLNNYSHVQKYQELSEKYKKRKVPALHPLLAGCGLFFALYLIGAVVGLVGGVFITVILFSILPSQPSQFLGSVIVMASYFIGFLAVLFWFIVPIFFAAEAGKSRNIKNELTKINTEVDMSKFEQIEKEYGHFNEIEALKEQSQAYIQQFFSGSDFAKLLSA
jgi:hypothetical protein